MTKQRIITQIGSLPYENVREAIDYSLKHNIPFLPELPKKGDLMIDYIKNPGQLSCLEEFKLVTRGMNIVKVQAVGPATIVSATNRIFSEEEAVERSYRHIIKIFDGLDTEKIILFLDEPSLETAGFDYKGHGMTKEEYESMDFVAIDYKPLWQGLYERLKTNADGKRVSWGIHTCGNMDWKQIFDIDFLEYISFDASKYSKGFMKHDRKNKKVAGGIKSPGDVVDFREGDLITPTCGLGNSDDKSICDSTLEILLNARAEIAR